MLRISTKKLQLGSRDSVSLIAELGVFVPVTQYNLSCIQSAVLLYEAKADVLLKLLLRILPTEGRHWNSCQFLFLDHPFHKLEVIRLIVSHV
uniref:Uncharacterized protein n=1 Tax=Anguilla anguilla TaxID=7936 RepID=A0A0E9W314_ANGAN